MRVEHLAQFRAVEISILIVVALIIVPLMYLVHLGLNRICFRHVTRYCEANGIMIDGWRISPEFDHQGVKTENTQIEVLTSDEKNGKRVFRFVVWVLGIRRISEHPHAPEADERESKSANKPAHPTAGSVLL
jgi:hypothetical protein